MSAIQDGELTMVEDEKSVELFLDQKKGARQINNPGAKDSSTRDRDI